jgi:hypothetical protein
MGGGGGAPELMAVQKRAGGGMGGVHGRGGKQNRPGVGIGVEGLAHCLAGYQQVRRFVDQQCA